MTRKMAFLGSHARETASTIGTVKDLFMEEEQAEVVAISGATSGKEPIKKAIG